MVPFLIGADGVVNFKHPSRTYHPVRANFGGLRHHLFDGASTPPLQGGEYVLVQHSYQTAVSGILPRRRTLLEKSAYTFVHVLCLREFPQIELFSSLQSSFEVMFCSF